MIDRKKIGLNRIVCPGLGLEDFIKLASDLGLAKIELRNDLPRAGIIDDCTPEEVKDYSKKYGIKIISINALQKFNLHSLLPEVTEQLKELIAFSVSIGCRAVVLCPNNDPDDKRSDPRRYEETAAALKAFAPLFEESGLWGYVEPLGFKESSLRSLLTAKKAIQESGCPSYKIVHDTFHHHIGPDNLETLKNDYDVSYTGLVHISGVERDLPAGRFKDEHRILVGHGDRLGSLEQVRLLLKLGYEGDISFEPFAEEAQNLGLEDLKIAVSESIEYILSE